MLLRFRRRSTRKRSFLLFELMVSLTLIALCLFPLIKPLAAIRSADKKELIEMQLWNASQTAFCQIKKLLYENETYSWDQLMKVKGVEDQLSDPFLVAVGPKKTESFVCFYTISYRGKVDKPSLHKVGLVVDIDIHFDYGKEPRHYLRTLYLEKQIA